MKNFIWILLVLLLLVLAVIVPTLLFLGVGYIFSTILPLSLFENTVLAIGSTFVLAFCIAAIAIAVQISRHGLFFPHEGMDEFDVYDEEDEDEYEDEYEDEDDEEDEYGNSRNSQLAAKIGRNALCPCGSGLKYKRCCGK